MKYLILPCLFLLMGTLLAQDIHQDPKAEAILDEMAVLLKPEMSYSFSFNCSFSFPEEEEQRYAGNFIQKSGKYRLESDLFLLVHTGKEIYSYQKEENSISINSPDEENTFNPAGWLEFYKNEKYAYYLSGREKVDEAYFDVIEFKPMDKQSDFFKVKLKTAQNTRIPKTLEVLYKDGSRLDILFSSFNSNPAISSNKFNFQTGDYPGALVEDLRID